MIAGCWWRIPVATLSVADTTVAQVTDTGVRAALPGATELRLAVGSVTSSVAIDVEQRIASLRLQRDTIRFDALRDTTTIHVIAEDSLGNPVHHPELVFEVGDGQVVALSADRSLEAVTPGITVLTLRDAVTGLIATTPIIVQQRVAAIDVAPITFDALGDTISITAIARDRLGSIVAGASWMYSLSDSTIAPPDSGARLRSAAEGRAVLAVTDRESGTVGTADVIVAQVATALSVVSMFGSPVITLAAGAPFPLSCQAVDRNGYTVVRDPVLLRTIKGTVTGSGCADARVAHSGYDTLMFASGNVQFPLAVIIATAPDSVGVLAAAQPLTTIQRDQFVGENLANPLILALRPLVNDILAAYGNPTTNLARARAIRDWVARTSVSPDPAVHPDGSTSNLSVLPPAATWADVNRVLSPQEWDADRTYWDAYMPSYEGYLMLDGLLGTLDPTTGRRADDGLMVHVEGALYRIRDIQSYHYTLCTYQALIVKALWAAAGLQGMTATTLDHDPAVVFIPELGRWVYEDPTMSEEYLLDGTGEPLSPVDLLTLSTNGQAARLRATKLSGPNFDPQPYIAGRSYMNVHPEGMVIMGSQLYNRAVGQRGWGGRFVQIDVPRLATAPAPLNDPTVYDRVSASDAFPVLGVNVQQLTVEDSVYVVTLSSTYPSHDHFERRINGGAWDRDTNLNVLPVGVCRLEYRSVDALGNISASAVLDVWAPRAEGFLQAGAAKVPAGGRNADAPCSVGEG